MPGRRPQLAKLTRPRLHNAVARDRLFTKLDAARAEHPAICVVGPPGAGKTTLAASWLDARSITGIWYQVDAGDCDLATLFYYLGEAARQFGRHSPLPALTAEYLHDVRGFSRRFFRDLFQRLPPDSTLVLDNYQEIPAEHQFHELIAEAVAEVPTGMTLLCVSRRDPPDCYARLIVNEDVAFVDWEDLKLTLQEAQSIALARNQSDSALIHDVYQRSGGWAAGMVLMLENLRLEAARPSGEEDSRQTLFSYFAAQILERVPIEVRDFLLATADLPWVEPPLGALLTGREGAGRILEDLCQRHLFTHRRAGVTPSYQYHALFQTFLRARADVCVPQAKRGELRMRAGRYLEGTGNPAEAFNLYRDAQVWTEAAQLVLRQAHALMAQGRFHTLSDWIGAFPREVTDEEPWLGYWHGRALAPFDPDNGRRRLERAYDGFRRRSDAVGEAVAAAGIIESIYIGNRAFVSMDPWIGILEGRLSTLERLPSPAMELCVYSSALIAMLYRQPANPLMATCLERLVALVETERDPNSRVSAAVSVLSYASASGDFAVGHRVQALIEPLVEAEEVAAAHRYLLHIWLGYFLMMLGEYAQAEANYRAAEQLNSDRRFHWSANLLFCEALCIIGGGDPTQALAGLEAMETATDRSRPQDLGYLRVARAWKGMIIGDAGVAQRESEAALALAEEVGNFSLTVVWQAPRMWALALTDRYDEFLHSMRESLRKVNGTCYRRPHVEWFAMKAWLHLRRGELEAARAALSEALSLAKSLGHSAFFHRLCRFAPALQAFTVTSRADPPFVRCLIRRFHWPAPAPEVDTWPWPIKIYTLGEFRVCLDEKPLSFPRKTPKKPLALLKALVAFGGQNVPEERLMDALWPDVPGDSAHHALSLALLRLRRLLAEPDAVRVADGLVSLNPDRVWTDVRAFEALSGDTTSETASQVGALYRGNFLAEESEQPWSVSLRERLRAKFLSTVDRHGQSLERAGQLDEAAAFYLGGLDAEPLAESFYQGLMRCYARQGRHAEALGTYRRLRQMLSVVLGTQPSRATETLASDLQGP